MITVDKITRGHPLLAFELDFQQLQGCARAASRQQLIALDKEFALGQSALKGPGVPRLQILPAEAGKRAGPGLEPTQTVADFLRRSPEIDAPVLFLQNGRQAGLRRILRTRVNGSR